MKSVGLVFSVLGAICGFVAAYYWYKASEVELTPAWELELRGDREKNVMGWVTGTMIAFRSAGLLNKRAALWTAAAVALTTISSVLLTFANT